MPIETPLIKYRQHSSQQIGARKFSLSGLPAKLNKLDAEQYSAEIQRFTEVRSRVSELLSEPDRSQFIRELDEKLKHISRRGQTQSAWHKDLAILKELFSLRYYRYGNGFRSFATDMLIRLRHKQ